MRSAEVISALNPLGVLARGYSVTYCGERIVRAAGELKEGDDITVKLASGRASAKVLSVSEDSRKSKSDFMCPDICNK